MDKNKDTLKESTKRSSLSLICGNRTVVDFFFFNLILSQRIQCCFSEELLPGVEKFWAFFSPKGGSSSRQPCLTCLSLPHETAAGAATSVIGGLKLLSTLNAAFLLTWASVKKMEEFHGLFYRFSHSETWNSSHFPYYRRILGKKQNLPILLLFW